jgi:hypothetical protein
MGFPPAPAFLPKKADSLPGEEEEGRILPMSRDHYHYTLWVRIWAGIFKMSAQEPHFTLTCSVMFFLFFSPLVSANKEKHEDCNMLIFK